MKYRSHSFTTEVLALGLFLAVLTALVGEVWGFDVSRYRPRLLKEVIQAHPARAGLIMTRDLPIRSQVIYSGEFRDLPDDSRRLIHAWAESMNVAGMPQAFKRELKIHEAGVDYWVPVQEVLVPVMMAELRPPERIELFLIYIGQVNGRHVFLVNAFDHEGPHPAHP
jgi:hypothetical protein